MWALFNCFDTRNWNFPVGYINEKCIRTNWGMFNPLSPKRLILYEEADALLSFLMGPQSCSKGEMQDFKHLLFSLPFPISQN